MVVGDTHLEFPVAPTANAVGGRRTNVTTTYEQPAYVWTPSQGSEGEHQ